MKRLGYSTKCVSVSGEKYSSSNSCIRLGVSWVLDGDNNEYYGRYNSLTGVSLAKKILALYGFDYDKEVLQQYRTYDVRLFSSGIQAMLAPFYMIESKDLKNGVIVSSDISFQFRHYMESSPVWQAKVVDMHYIEQVVAAVDSNTKIVILDPVSVPKFEQYDIRSIVQKVKAKNPSVLVMVDNTYLSSYYYNPFKDGADIVVESLGKYCNGHGDAMGGVVIVPTILSQSFAFRNINSISCPIDPMSAFLIDRGISTLKLRMDRITDTGNKVYEWFLSKKVIDVRYLGRSGLITFSFKNGFVNKKFVDMLKVFKYGVSFGSDVSYCDSIIDYYGTSDWKAYCRLAIGLEDAADLIADLESAWSVFVCKYCWKTDDDGYYYLDPSFIGV